MPIENATPITSNKLVEGRKENFIVESPQENANRQRAAGFAPAESR